MVITLKTVREKKGWTQEVTAQKLGLSLSHYRKIENQKTKALTYEVLDNLVKTLECDISDILQVRIENI